MCSRISEAVPMKPQARGQGRMVGGRPMASLGSLDSLRSSARRLAARSSGTSSAQLIAHPENKSPLCGATRCFTGISLRLEAIAVPIAIDGTKLGRDFAASAGWQPQALEIDAAIGDLDVRAANNKDRNVAPTFIANHKASHGLCGLIRRISLRSPSKSTIARRPRN